MKMCSVHLYPTTMLIVCISIHQSCWVFLSLSIHHVHFKPTCWISIHPIWLFLFESLYTHHVNRLYSYPPNLWFSLLFISTTILIVWISIHLPFWLFLFQYNCLYLYSTTILNGSKIETFSELCCREGVPFG